MVEIEPIWIEWPYARIRRVISTDDGTITRFVVQLEYDVTVACPGNASPSWRVVARFDHDSSSEGGHDVTEDGLHLDIYREGRRYERLRSFPRLRAGPAMRYCEEYLLQNSDRLLARFEQWHDLCANRDRD